MRISSLLFFELDKLTIPLETKTSTLLFSLLEKTLNDVPNTLITALLLVVMMNGLSILLVTLKYASPLNSTKRVLPVNRLGYFMMLLAFNTLVVAGDSAREIERDANGALSQFYHEVKGSKEYLENAKAYLIFPDVDEGGFFLGGRYGEGVLRIGGKTKAFYSITGLSAGFQAGVKNYALVIAVTSQKALDKLLLDDDWETEVDVNIDMAEWNSDEELDDIDYGTDLVGFVFDSKGMMGNFSLERTKFERINPHGSKTTSYY